MRWQVYNCPYEAAGGAVLRDLFDADSAGWLTDRELVDRLAAEKLAAAAATVRGEGWKWVEIMPGLDWETLHRFGHALSLQLGSPHDPFKIVR
jgi:ParB family transcriptional regulator, chromosome partitioning protein